MYVNDVIRWSEQAICRMWFRRNAVYTDAQTHAHTHADTLPSLSHTHTTSLMCRERYCFGRQSPVDANKTSIVHSRTAMLASLPGPIHDLLLKRQQKKQQQII